MANQPGERPFLEGMSFDQRLLLWQQTKDTADKFVALERRQRMELFNERFKAIEGAQNVELGTAGWKLKGEMPHNYTLLNKEGETRTLVQRWAAMAGETALLAARLITWKPELRVGEYKKLPTAMSQTMDSAKILTIKPGLPTLEIVKPKGA